jgi:hypothetical protein
MLHFVDWHRLGQLPYVKTILKLPALFQSGRQPLLTRDIVHALERTARIQPTGAPARQIEHEGAAHGRFHARTRRQPDNAPPISATVIRSEESRTVRAESAIEGENNGKANQASS